MWKLQKTWQIQRAFQAEIFKRNVLQREAVKETTKQVSNNNTDKEDKRGIHARGDLGRDITKIAVERKNWSSMNKMMDVPRSKRTKYLKRYSS